MKDPPLASALRRLAVKQLRTVRDLDDPERLATEEGIHDMRVALRRLRSLWRVAESTGDKRAKKLRKRAADRATSLGLVRELDVLMLRIAADAGAGHLAPPEANKWLAKLRRKRKKALAEILQSLGDEDWLEGALKWTRERRKGPSVSEALPELVREQALALVGHGKPEDEAAQHRFRIEVKRLRYLLEFFEGSADSIKILTAAQDALGDIRDRQAVAELARAEGLDAYADWLVSLPQVNLTDQALQVAESLAQVPSS